MIPNRCGTSKRQAQLRADDQGIWNVARAAGVDDVLNVGLNVACGDPVIVTLPPGLGTKFWDRKSLST